MQQIQLSNNMILRFDSKLTKTVDSLRKGVVSRAEIIRRSIALLKIAVEANKNGDKVVLVAKDGTEREIVLN